MAILPTFAYQASIEKEEVEELYISHGMSWVLQRALKQNLYHAMMTLCHPAVGTKKDTIKASHGIPIAARCCKMLQKLKSLNGLHGIHSKRFNLCLIYVSFLSMWKISENCLFRNQKGPGFDSCPTMSNFLRCVQRASMTAGLQPLRKALTTKPSALSPASSGKPLKLQMQGQQSQEPLRNHPDCNLDFQKYICIISYINISYINILLYYIIISYSYHIQYIFIQYHSLVPVEWSLSSMLNGIRKTWGFHDFQDSIKASESKKTSPGIPCSSNLGQVMRKMGQKWPKVAKGGQKSGDHQGIIRGQGTFAPWIRRLHGPFSAPPCDRCDRCDRCHRTFCWHGQKLLLQFSSKLRISLGPRSLFVSVENC